jgi:hypothetical protein
VTFPSPSTIDRRMAAGLIPPRMRAATTPPQPPTLRESIAARLGIDPAASNQEILAAVDAVNAPPAASYQPDPESLLWAAAYGGSAMASEILAAKASTVPTTDEELAYQAVFGARS